MSDDDMLSEETLVVVRRDGTSSPIQPQSEFLQKVQAGGADYILLTTALEDTYTLTLTDGSRCFKGDANASQDVQVSSLTCSALTTGSGTRFAYSVDVVDDGALQFVWKQVLDDQRGGLRRKLGSTVLRRVQEDANSPVMEVLAGAVRVVQDAEARLARTTDQLERLKCDHNRALDQLEQCARTKESLEGELYSKFALVLNSKKRRIAELLGEQTTKLADEPMAGSEDEPVVQQAANRQKEKPVAKPKAKQTTKRLKGKLIAKCVVRPTWEDRSESGDEPVAVSEDKSVTDAVVQQGTSRQKSVAKPAVNQMINRRIKKLTAKHVPTQTTRSTREDWLESDDEPVAKLVIQQRASKQKEKSVAEPVAIQIANRWTEKSTAKCVARQTTSSTSGDWLESNDESMAGSEDEVVAEPVVQQVTGRQKSVAKLASQRPTNRWVGESVAKHVARQTTGSTQVDGTVAEPVAEQTTRSRQALQSTSVHDLIESLM